MGLPKTYRASARFGAVSTTGDPEGEITETGKVPAGARWSSRSARSASARPHTRRSRSGGERAYRRARRGRTSRCRERFVTVYRFDERWREGDRAELEIECSSGTYVRSLVADLGDAYCESLRRTAIGPFSVEEAGATAALELDRRGALDRLTLKGFRARDEHQGHRPRRRQAAPAPRGDRHASTACTSGTAR